MESTEDGTTSDIIVVDGGNSNRSARKRTRNDANLPAVDEGAPPVHRGTMATDDSHQPEGGSDPSDYLQVMDQRVEEGAAEEPDEKSDIQRLLEAKHRRRRQGKHMSQAEVDEDLEDVKRFLALSEADRKAYLSIYEYDGSRDNLIEGMAKASSLALRMGLAYTIPAEDYDLATMAMEMPEVKDSLATIWDCVDFEEYASGKALKFFAAVGHVGDTLVSAAMKLYQGVSRAADLRRRSADILRRKEAGLQSVFDQRAVHNHGTKIHESAQGAESSSGSTDEKPPQVYAAI